MREFATKPAIRFKPQAHSESLLKKTGKEFHFNGLELKACELEFSTQLPPSSEIQNYSLTATTENWFEYPVRSHPHHTDFAGIVWHGTYVAWMEEARVECLRSIGIDFADLVALGCDLPVVEMSLRYHRPVRMGMTAIVKTRMAEMEGVRINWDYQIQSPDRLELYLTGRVTLVAVDREKGKILRQLPSAMKDALVKLSFER